MNIPVPNSPDTVVFQVNSISVYSSKVYWWCHYLDYRDLTATEILITTIVNLINIGNRKSGD